MDKDKLRYFSMLPRWRIRVEEQFDLPLPTRIFWEWCDAEGKSSRGNEVKDGRWILFKEELPREYKLNPSTKTDFTGAEDVKAWKTLLKWAIDSGYTDVENADLTTDQVDTPLFRISEDPRIFVSYSWANQDFVRRMARKIRATHSLFLDVDVMDQELIIDLERLRSTPREWASYGRPGIYSWDHLKLNLFDAIEDSSIILYWHSKNSSSSKWVQEELAYGVQKGVTVIAISVDDTPMPNHVQISETINWENAADDLPNLIGLLEATYTKRQSDLKANAHARLLDVNKQQLEIEIVRRDKAPTNGEMVWNNSRINRLLGERYDLSMQLGKDPSADVFFLDRNRITANEALVGNLIISRKYAGERSKEWPRYCARCAGMVNYYKVYPHLSSLLDSGQNWTFINDCGCRCP